MQTVIRSNGQARYTNVAITLHWAIALLILCNLPLGFVMEGYPQPLRRTLVGLHATFGLSVIVLSVIRVAWRLTHRPPPLSASMTWVERTLAHTVHCLLYGLMFFMPLMGWSILSANQPRPGPWVVLFGTIPFPKFGFMERWELPFQKVMHDNFVGLHSLGALVMIALLLLHVLGALKHQFIDREKELARMGIGRTGPA
jgi:cytochrome b561